MKATIIMSVVYETNIQTKKELTLLKKILKNLSKEKNISSKLIEGGS